MTDTAGETGVSAHALFTGRVIDNDPALLRESYQLRYRVYCDERAFLPAADYPDGLETDVYDSHSLHVGVLNTHGAVAATARLIEQSDDGLPLFDHCSVSSHERQLHDPALRIVELSRLCVSRRYNRRAGDSFYSLEGTKALPVRPDRRRRGELPHTLYKTLYQASKRRGFTHWLAATEQSLQRLIARYALPFQVIGPETDYYGRVSPYLVDLREWDEVILSRRVPLLNDFLDGLAPEHRPVTNASVIVGSTR
jgi:N-acyl amino acid synthase of PEP-CTERM/exosortase system